MTLEERFKDKQLTEEQKKFFREWEEAWSEVSQEAIEKKTQKILNDQALISKIKNIKDEFSKK